VCAGKCGGAASVALGNVQAPDHGRTGEKGAERPVDAAKVSRTDQLCGLVETEQRAYPGENCHIGDGVQVPHDPVPPRELLFQHAQEAAGLANITVTRALVLEVLTGKLVEESDLTKHRADSAHLEHQPLDGLMTTGGG